ncbi:hypothetical protein GCM10007968_05670 [Sporolactobacillus putidus]|uniref:Response regulatory domain-containing protein n=1 Tax=Sporolactobacillus putidus TaxID=492735 RepID=A0A917VY74_9BACL|nr:hypothetical protein GCM10007968_05670 [Sporolactobacillus putidus]
MEDYNVLVVDDDKEIRDVIGIYLKNEGIHVLTAKDGLEAIDLLRCYSVHLILLDIMMPRLDGIQTTFKIREQKNIPIIMISAKSEDMDKILGLQIGADDYDHPSVMGQRIAWFYNSSLSELDLLNDREALEQWIQSSGVVLYIKAMKAVYQIRAEKEIEKLPITEQDKELIEQFLV